MSDRRKEKKHLESDKPETDERDQRKHTDLHQMLDSQKMGDDDYSVATDIDLIRLQINQNLMKEIRSKIKN